MPRAIEDSIIYTDHNMQVDTGVYDKRFFQFLKPVWIRTCSEAENREASVLGGMRPSLHHYFRFSKQ
jgi:hypothetical protein